MHIILFLAISLIISASSGKAEEYRFHRMDCLGLMYVVVDSKGVSTTIQFDIASDAKSMAVWDALMEAEINGTEAPCEYNGLFFDQPIIFTGEFTSEILHTPVGPEGSDAYRMFKVSSLKIGFPFSRLRYPMGSRDAEQTVLETHFGFDSLFPKGIKLDGKKIDLSNFRKVSPTTLDTVPSSESTGEQE